MDYRKEEKEISPQVMENREFVKLEEEDIQKLNRAEADKFEQNPKMKEIMGVIETETGRGGRWEEHWMTVDASGRRVYTRVYSAQGRSVALTSDGRKVRDFNYPVD